jgi:hypothetical protein
LEESGDEEAEGGGEKERGIENRPEIHVFRPDISLYLARDPAGRGFLSDPARDLTLVTSPTPCPDPVVPFPSPILVAGRREKKKNERERERDEVERYPFFFFFFKGREI